MDLALTGKTALITGASGGIGRELARAFHAEGCKLALHTHSKREWLEGFIAENGWQNSALILQADLSDAAQAQAEISKAAEHFGGLDICIANAGIWPSADKLLHEMPAERAQRTIAVNLLGSMFTAQAFMLSLVKHSVSEGAALTFIGSTAGRFGEKGHCDYAAAKAGLEGLMRSLKNEIVELDQFGRINMIEPGWTVTDMAKEALDTDGVISQIVSTMPLRQIARAVDIARAAVMLSSPYASRHITGQVVTIAGGMEGRKLWDAGSVDESRVRMRTTDKD